MMAIGLYRELMYGGLKLDAVLLSPHSRSHRGNARRKNFLSVDARTSRDRGALTMDGQDQQRRQLLDPLSFVGGCARPVCHLLLMSGLAGWMEMQMKRDCFLEFSRGIVDDLYMLVH